MAATMKTLISSILLLVLASLSLANAGATPASKLTVRGTVFCDTCSTNTLSAHTYFLPDAEVQVECILKGASSQRVRFHAKTDKNGAYEVEVPSSNGFQCEKSQAVCQATLIKSSSSVCSSPGSRSSAAGEMQVVVDDQEETQQCNYHMKELSYRPSKKDSSLCDQKLDQPNHFFGGPHFGFGLPPWFRGPGFQFPPWGGGNPPAAPGPSSPHHGHHGGFFFPPPWGHLPPWIHH